MADDIKTFQVTTPAGQAINNPLVTPLAMPPRTVIGVEVMAPAGSNGNLGFQLGSAGQQVIPSDIGTWIITSGETLRWEVANQINSGAWQMISYNTGNFPHTLYLRFFLNLIQANAPAAPTLIPADQLSSSLAPELSLPPGSVSG